MDRGIYSSTIFIKALQKTNVLNEFSTHFLINQVEQTIGKYFGQGNSFGVDKLYYLATDKEKCIEQIYKRNRSEEQNIDRLSLYLDNIEEGYMAYITDFKNINGDSSVRCFYDQDINIVAKDLINFLGKY